MKHTVTVSADVHKALTLGKLDADQILRDALNIKQQGLEAIFPEGTAFLAWYKDRPYWGKVHDGAFEIKGERFPSVSAAACKVTGRPTCNGWDFWQAKLPGRAEFVRISKLRQSGGR